MLLILFRAAVNKPFGAMGGFIDLVEKKGALNRLGMSGFVRIGIVIGGAVFGLASGTFTPSFTYAAGSGFLPADPILALLVLLAAGTVMGFGARLAGGCTSGHGLSGMSLRSPASMAATMTFFATAVVLANVFASILGVARS
jgi:hypothetical protein